MLAKNGDEFPLVVFLSLVVNLERRFLTVGRDADDAADAGNSWRLLRELCRESPAKAAPAKAALLRRGSGLQLLLLLWQIPLLYPRARVLGRDLGLLLLLE